MVLPQAGILLKVCCAALSLLLLSSAATCLRQSSSLADRDFVGSSSLRGHMLVPVTAANQRQLLDGSTFENTQNKSSSLTAWWKALLLPKVSKGAVAKQKGCHKDCTQRGNCNLDTQQCECRFGYGGEDCSKPLAPACTVVESGEIIDVLGQLLRSCECYRQLSKLFYVTIGGEMANALFWTFTAGANYPCFERKKLPAAKQNSTWPSPDEEVGWHRILFHPDPTQTTLLDISEADAMLYRDGWGQEWNHIRPEKTVANGFKSHEKCAYRVVSSGRRQIECTCSFGYWGATCMKVTDNDCPNNCNGNGVCKATWCHCNKGWFGFDCSRNESHIMPDPTGTQRAVTQFKIFMYEIPPNLAYDDRRHDPNYIAYIAFRDMLARDWTIRTQNPWEASLFFIPDNGYWSGGNVGEWWAHQHRVFQYLNTTYPFWQRYGGRDHFHFIARDRGACDVRLPRDAPLLPPIKLVHFGYHKHLSEYELGRAGQNVKYEFTRAHSEACFRPMKDLVVPGYVAELDAWAENWQTLPKTWKRDILMFFRGGIRPEDKEYSGGIRQKLQELLHENADVPDISFNKDAHSDVAYDELFRRSIFCLAPWGHGFGLRLMLALASGCIPVIMQDNVLQPFEYILPYHEFSIRLSSRDVPILVPLLRGITREEIARLQGGIKRHYKSFMWQPGGLAYNQTISALKQHWTLFKAGVDRRKRTLMAREHIT